MRQILFIAVLYTISINVAAQTTENVKYEEVIANECDTLSEIQSTFDACLLFSDALAAENKDSIMLAGKALKECDLADFDSLRCEDDSDSLSLIGHAVFNDIFADSLAAGRDAYQMADDINTLGQQRGQMKGVVSNKETKQILTKTCVIKARGVTTYSFSSTGHQELAVVAEPGGRITTRIHAVNKTTGLNRWYNDTTDVTKGRNSRKVAFELPQSPTTTVKLEIKNCTNRNISFVVISN